MPDLPIAEAWLDPRTDEPFTRGLPGVDWIIADRYVMPPELEPYCTEKPIRLPNCYQVSDRQREVAPRPQRSTYGLPEDQFVYCSFNNNFKFTPEVFAVLEHTAPSIRGEIEITSAIQTLALIEMGGSDSQTLVGQGYVSGSSALAVDNATVAQATWRGIVGLWGNVWQMVDGLQTDELCPCNRAVGGATL
mgnify:CR=1 FL=1